VCWSFGGLGWGGIRVAGFSLQPATRIPHWLCVLVSMYVGVSVWLVGVVTVWQASACCTDTTPTSHIETPTHIETRTHNQCGDTIKKSQAPDDGCINVRNLSSREEVK